MPSLTLFKSPGGVAPRETIPLDGDQYVIGRDAEVCQIVIPHHAVSRRHALLTRNKGKYFVEDLKSRNHTFVNGKEVTGPTPIKAEDTIKICDFVFRFQDPVRQPLPPELLPEPVEPIEPNGTTTIEATGTRASAKGFLEVQPTDRLRALLEISSSLARTLALGPLLDQVAETVFGVFKQADRCFVLLLDETGRPVPKVVKARRPGVEDTRFSKTIVRKALDSMQSFLSEDASVDPTIDPAASIADFKIRSVMCVPLATAEGRPVGAIQLDTQDRAKKFKEEDLKLLIIVANLASVVIEKAKLHETALAREKEQGEIELARTVQLGFLPQTLPEVPGYDFFTHYSPAQTVGGDYYDFIQLPNNRLAIVVADVAGKGVSAALLVAKMSSEVRFSLLTEPNPGKAITLFNDQMVRGGLGHRFITLSLAVLDPAAHLVTLVNAGHPSPKLYRAGSGRLEDAISIAATGYPIGVEAGYQYESIGLELSPGDTITAFTDGVTDSVSPSGEMFGLAGVVRCLEVEDSVQLEASRPKQTGERLVQTVRRHAAGRPQPDDIAVVCFGRVDSEHVTSVARASTGDS